MLDSEKINADVETIECDKMEDGSMLQEATPDKSKEINERKEEIRKEDSKKIGKFILICTISGLIGGIVGAGGMVFVTMLEESGMSFVEFWNQLQRDFTTPASVLLIVFDVIFILISLAYYLKGKKIWNSNMDEDEKYAVVDKKLSLSIIYSNVCYFINFAFFGFAFYAGLSIVEEASETELLIYIRLVDLVVFMATLFICLSIQKACVNLTKLMNPEKKGSIYDTKFDKVWYESCDEAERMQIGIAGYQTVKATNITIIILMVIFVCASMFFEIGILPLAIIAVIGLVVNITYGVASMKAGAGCGSSSSVLK